MTKECVNIYNYLNSFCYDSSSDKREQYNPWYVDQYKEAEISSEKITKKTIDKYGLDWLSSHI